MSQALVYGAGGRDNQDKESPTSENSWASRGDGCLNRQPQYLLKALTEAWANTVARQKGSHHARRGCTAEGLLSIIFKKKCNDILFSPAFQNINK